MKVAPKRRYHGLPRFTPANVASWLLHSPNDSPCPLLQPLKGTYGDKKTADLLPTRELRPVLQLTYTIWPRTCFKYWKSA